MWCGGERRDIQEGIRRRGGERGGQRRWEDRRGGVE